jgi:transcription initiation factor TFIIIB Brf1 subunit/transcription initiation factor TFIIB
MLKHLKTFETFEYSAEDMAMPECPLCHSTNVDCIAGTDDCECVDCGEIFTTTPVTEKYDMDDMDDEAPFKRELIDDADYEMDQEQKYYIDNKKILTIMTNAKEYGQELVDQLNNTMELSDSYLEFTQLAIKDIINVMGVSDDEAMIIFDELTIQ